jgi:hypothetical protein
MPTQKGPKMPPIDLTRNLTEATEEQLRAALDLKTAARLKAEQAVVRKAEAEKQAKLEVLQKTNSQLISQKVADLTASLRECEKLADEAGICFSFSPIYGMGGTYYPTKDNRGQSGDWMPSSEGWQSSSENC